MSPHIFRSRERKIKCPRDAGEVPPPPPSPPQPAFLHSSQDRGVGGGNEKKSKTHGASSKVSCLDSGNGPPPPWCSPEWPDPEASTAPEHWDPHQSSTTLNRKHTTATRPTPFAWNRLRLHLSRSSRACNPSQGGGGGGAELPLARQSERREPVQTF